MLYDRRKREKERKEGRPKRERVQTTWSYGVPGFLIGASGCQSVSNAQVERSCYTRLCSTVRTREIPASLNSVVLCVHYSSRTTYPSLFLTFIVSVFVVLAPAVFDRDKTDFRKSYLLWFRIPLLFLFFYWRRETTTSFGIQTDMAVVNGLQTATGTQLENLINKCECDT